MEVERSVRKLLDPLWDDALKLKIPVYLQFEVTSRCNMMCRMCYIASNCEENRRRELSADKWLEIAKQARDMGLITVNITGGEPIMKDDFWQLHEGLTNLGVIYTLNTNGTLMTKENVKRLSQNPPFRALVSIYGGSEETYAKVTTNGKWFDQARAGVENLLEAGIQTIIRMTLIKDNVDDLQKVFEWADSLGQDLFYSDYMSPRREGDDTDPIGTRLDPEQRIHVRETVRRLYMKREEKRKKENPESGDIPVEIPEFGDESPEIKADIKPEEPSHSEPYRFMTEDGFGCGAGKLSGFISYDGNLIPCSKPGDVRISLTEKTFSEGWKELVNKCRKVPSCSDCLACDLAKYCVPCPPKIMAETGSYCEKSAYLCEYAQRLKIYSEKLKFER